MNDKLSKYNFEIDYDEGFLLYNAMTDTILPISLEDYAIVETLMEHLPEFLETYPDLYAVMKKSGFITDSDFDELAFLKLRNKQCVFINKDYRININPTLDCNLKCWYCSVDYAGTKHNKERMNDEVVEGVNNHIIDLVEQQKAQSLLIDWFGGEPLMYYDEVIKIISDNSLKILSNKKIEFNQQITTNATYLNEDRIQQMKDWSFTSFQIPIDGNENRHNQIKFYANNKGTYKDIINNINLIVDIIPKAHIVVRINYDTQTLKNIKEIILDFSEKTKKNISIDFQRVWQIPCTDQEKELLKNAKEAFRTAGFRSSFWAYRPKSYKCCYADSYYYYAINYDGKVYKCTARDYGDELVIGELLSSGRIVWNESRLSKYFEKSTFENEHCEQCKKLPLCMGPCIQKNYEMRVKNSRFRCLHENVEYDLSSHVIEMAKRRNLIQ